VTILFSNFSKKGLTGPFEFKRA